MCAATYNNTHKITGTRVSKLERWLQEQLVGRYDFPILFNDKTAIGSELDIFIPHLNLAFELNGIFHFEPIFGDKKLSQIKTNDANKFQACQAHGISLCVIDTSAQKYFKPATSQEYIDIVINLVESTRVELV